MFGFGLPIHNKNSTLHVLLPFLFDIFTTTTVCLTKGVKSDMNEFRRA